MKYLKYITEMADIIKKGQKLSINNKPLKSFNVKEVQDNMLYWRCDKPTFMYDEGDTFVWFIKDDASRELLKDGQNLVFFPVSIGFGRNAPIEDIWKKNNPLQKSIIGCIRAYTDDSLVYIDMMSVRPGYMKNGINNFMIQFLTEQYPNAILKFSKPTKEGEGFIKKYYPTAKIEGQMTDEDITDLLNKLKTNQSILQYTSKDLLIAVNKLQLAVGIKRELKYDDLFKLLNDYLLNRS